jgi:hypothetical protein
MYLASRFDAPVRRMACAFPVHVGRRPGALEAAV